MGKGAYMGVLNLDAATHQSKISDKNCMYWNGEDGSRLEVFENNAVYQPGGSIGPVYIQADGSGGCAMPWESSEFQINFNQGGPTGGYVKLHLESSLIPVSVVNAGGPVWVNLTAAPDANAVNPWGGQPGIGVIRSNANPPSPEQYFSMNGESWMGALIDANRDFLGRQVNMVSLPASHDAGMSTVTNHTTFGNARNTVTQNIPVSGQLTAGARYFDVRPSVWKNSDPNQFFAGHFGEALGGQGCLGESLLNILTAVRDFINRNSREIVILKFSHYQDSDAHSFPVDVQRKMIALVQEILQTQMLTAAPAQKVGLLTIGQIIDGGKRVICVFDSLDSSLYDAGKGILRCWGLNGDNPVAIPLENLSNFDLYDDYSHTENAVHMMINQIGKYRKFSAAGLNNGEMFLFSHTLTLSDFDSTPVGGGSILNLAERARPWLWDLANVIYPVQSPDGFVRPPNLVYVDAVDADIRRNTALWAALYFNSKVPSPLKLGHVPIAIRSSAFNDVGLRAEISGRCSNCQWGIGPGERFYLIPTGTDGQYYLQAVGWGNYLTLDPQGVTQSNPAGFGQAMWTDKQTPSGVLSVQSVEDGLYTIGSVQYPNVYLRMNSNGQTQFDSAGIGIANCQIGAGPWEKFYIVAA